MPNLIAEADYQRVRNDPGGLYRAEIREGFEKHTLAMLDYPAPRKHRSLIPEGTPLTFTWGWAPVELRTFYGYVNHHEIIEGSDGNQFMRTYCLGPSMALNEPGQQSWEKVTASFIAKTVAEKWGLRSVLHRSSRVLGYFAQGNESDFAMLKRLADTVGYRFWVEGTTLFFLDPVQMLRQPSGSFTPTFEMHRDGTGDTLQDVKVVSGSMAPGGAAVQEVYGLDGNTGALIKSTSSQVFAKRGLIRPARKKIYRGSVGSLQEANDINESSAAKGAWASVEASAVGTPKVLLGRLVELTGDALNDEHEGNWLVTDASHVLDLDATKQATYYVDMSLSRNQRAVSPANPTRFRQAFRDVSSRISRNRWKSVNLESVYV